MGRDKKDSRGEKKDKKARDRNRESRDTMHSSTGVDSKYELHRAYRISVEFLAKHETDVEKDESAAEHTNIEKKLEEFLVEQKMDQSSRASAKLKVFSKLGNI